MQPAPLTAVGEAHVALLSLLDGLDDAQVSGDSALPGWSRGHVLAHLTDNARMFARLARHALRDELVDTYDGGQTERDAIIEANASRDAATHRAELACECAALESVWKEVAAQDAWGRRVTFRDGDIGTTVYARWREVWIHMVDLALGAGPADWLAELAAHAVDFLLVRLPADTVLLAEDVDRRWTTGEPRTAVTGGVRDLAAWLAGRVPPTVPDAPRGLPQLGPWPPHPPRRDRP